MKTVSDGAFLNMFQWKRYHLDIILLTVRWYLRYNVSLYDLVQMIEELGLIHFSYNDYGIVLNWTKESNVT